MRRILGGVAMACVLGSATAQAGGYTNPAVPTGVRIVSGGVLIEGQFGDPTGCGMPNYVFMSQSSTTFKEIVAMAYTALSAGRTLQFYANSCGEVGFHWSGNVINFVSDGHAATIR